MKLQPSTLAVLALTVTSSFVAAEKPNEPQPKLKAPKAPICKLPACEVKVKQAIMTSAQVFAQADKDKDGKLSAEEFTAAYQLIVIQEQLKAAQKPKPKPMPVAPHPVGPGDGCPGCGLG